MTDRTIHEGNFMGTDVRHRTEVKHCLRCDTTMEQVRYADIDYKAEQCPECGLSLDPDGVWRNVTRTVYAKENQNEND